MVSILFNIQKAPVNISEFEPGLFTKFITADELSQSGVLNVFSHFVKCCYRVHSINHFTARHFAQLYNYLNITLQMADHRYV